MTYESRNFAVSECMPSVGAIDTYVKYALLQATNGTSIYHLGSILPILLNELNLRGYYVDAMYDQGFFRPFTVLALLLGKSADGKSTSAMTAVHHVCGFLEREEDEFGHVKRRRRFEFAGTPEGIRYALATEFFDPVQQATTAFLYQEELTAVFAKSNGDIAEFLMRLYDGRDMSEAQRQHQKASAEGVTSHGVIVNPRVNGLFCSTHDNLSYHITKSMASGGLYGRLLIFTGDDRRQPYEGDIAGDKKRLELREQWRQASEHQLAQWSSFLDNEFETSAGSITIAPDGHAVFKEWHEQYEKLVTNMDDNLRAMIRRSTRTAWMVAALYATTRLSLTINADDALRAQKLVDKCFKMGERLNHLFEGGDYIKKQEAILAAVKKAKTMGVQLSALFTVPGINGKGVKQGELHELLDTLEAAKQIVKVRETGKSRGRPATVFYDPQHAPIATSGPSPRLVTPASDLSDVPNVVKRKAIIE